MSTNVENEVDVILTVGSTEFSTLVQSFMFTFTLDALHTLILSQRREGSSSSLPPPSASLSSKPTATTTSSSESTSPVKVLAQIGHSDLPIGWNLGLRKIRKGGANGTANLDIEVVDFLPDLEQKIAKTSLVISHAGAGSILSFLRPSLDDHQRTEPTTEDGRTLILVPNESLMDSHQSDLADEMSKSHWALVSTARDLPDFLRKLAADRAASNDSFAHQSNQRLPDLVVKPPPFDSSKAPRIVDETLGF